MRLSARSSTSSFRRWRKRPMMALDPLPPKQRRPLSPICAVNRHLGLIGFWRLTGALDPIVKGNTPRPRTEPLDLTKGTQKENVSDVDCQRRLDRGCAARQAIRNEEGDTDAAIDDSAAGGSAATAVCDADQWLL